MESKPKMNRPAGPRAKAAHATSPPNAVSPWVRLRSATYHPFLYERMIGAVDPTARPGNVVNVYDKAGAPFGRGLFNPRSRIVLRMLTHDDAPIDDAFWQARLGQAVALRRRLNLDETTDAYRLVHAEGDGLSGLVVERYADCLVFELFSLGMFQRREQIARWLGDILGPPTCLDRPHVASQSWRTIIRADPHIERAEGFGVPADERTFDGTITIREHGIRYRVDVAAGHKTGFFCDQRENRHRFASLCKDATVLDLCCYTAGFGLCAKLLGGASDVTSVDLDEAAVALARANVNLNQTRLNLVHSDAFIYLRQMLVNGRQYDAVVLDPPKFAKSRDDVDAALITYNDLNSLALQAVRPGGILLTCSCSGLVSFDMFTSTVQRAARRANRSLQVIGRSGAAADHPIMLNCPESEYLKALWLRVL